MASSNKQDYQETFTDKVQAARNEITTRFKSFRETLDLKEKTVLEQVDRIFSENINSIKELQTCRTQTMQSKANLSKTVKNSNLLDSLSKDFGSTLKIFDSQIENLSTIKFSWNVPTSFWDNLILIDECEENTKIDNNVTTGDTSGNLSNDLKDMKIHEDKIYISDKGAKAIKIFKRNGQFFRSYTNAKLQTPGSITVHRDYLYVLTDQYTDEDYKLSLNANQKILLFKISTLTLDTLSIVVINYIYGVIDTDGYSLYLLLLLLGASDQASKGMFANKSNMSVSTRVEKWNFSLYSEGVSQLSSIGKYFPPLQAGKDAKQLTRYQKNNYLVQFYDMKIHNKEMLILFSNSIYLLQSFDLNGNLLRVMIEENLTQDIVGIEVCPQKNGLIILRDRTNSKILIFSNQGELIRAVESADTSHGLKHPMCMDVDARGNLVVCDGKDTWRLQEISI